MKAVGLRLAQHTGNLAHQLGHIGIIAYADVTSVRGFVREPVTCGRAGAVVFEASSALCGEPVHVEAHGSVTFAQDTLVSGHEIDGPRYDDPGIGPSGVAEAPEVAERRDFRICPIFALALAQVVQPFAVEGARVGIIGSRACEHLCVARPAEAFVALWAVGGHAQEIVALAPDDVAVKLVHVRMVGFKRGQFIKVGADELSRKLADFHIRGGCYLTVTEAEERGGGLECLAVFRSFQRIVQGGFRRA